MIFAAKLLCWEKFVRGCWGHKKFMEGCENLQYAAAGRGRCRNVVLCYFMRFKLDIFKTYLKKELKFEMQNAKIEGSNPLYYRIINFQHGYWFFFQTALLLFW